MEKNYLTPTYINMKEASEKRIEEIAESAGKLQLQEITFEEHMNLVEKLFTSHHQATLEEERKKWKKKLDDALKFCEDELKKDEGNLVVTGRKWMLEDLKAELL